MDDLKKSREFVLAELNAFSKADELREIGAYVDRGMCFYCDGFCCMSIRPRLDVVLAFCCRLIDDVERYHLTKHEVDKLKLQIVPIMKHCDVLRYLSGQLPYCDGSKFARLLSVNWRELGY